MSLKNTLKAILLLLSDVAVLYVSLFLTLILRYGGDFYNQFTDRHFFPFTIIFFFWIVVFYIAGIYDLRRLHNNLDFFKILGLSIFINSIIAVFFFYLIPIFGITPKTNLFIFIAVFTALEFFWRRSFNVTIASGEAPNRVLLLGSSATADEISDVIKLNPQLGCEIKVRLAEDVVHGNPQALRESVSKNGVNLVVVPHHLKNDAALMRVLYDLLGQGAEIKDLVSFYELVLRKIPLADLEEVWFLENLTEQQKFYDPLKRAVEFLGAVILAVVLFPLGLLIALLIKLTSTGPIIYRQVRIGEREKKFTLYKFRTMQMHSNHAWPEENDNRITKIGKILRKTHLDELPQLWNIINGNISVVGPRPDFVDFYKELEKEIPYYTIRTLIRPGLTGWAQIHQPITASLEETKERLEYDLYYLKNRSLLLDLTIILKTIKVFVTAKGR